MIALTDTQAIDAAELSTVRLRARLKNNGTPIPLEAITSWTATLYCADDDDKPIIGGRDGQVLVEDGVIASDLDGFFRYEEDGEGLLTAFFIFPPANQAILDRKLKYEKHVCQFEIVIAGTAPDPGDTIRPKFVIQVENLGRVG